MENNQSIRHEDLATKYSAKIRQATRFKKIQGLFKKKGTWAQTEMRKELGIEKSTSTEARLLGRDLEDMVDLGILKKVDQICPLCQTRFARAHYVKMEAWNEFLAVSEVLKKVFSRMEQ